MKAPAFYKVKYLQEIVPEQVEEDAQATFIGDAFHYLMEHGSDKFLQKYKIGDGFLKKDYAEMILKRANEKMTPAKLAKLDKEKQDEWYAKFEKLRKRTASTATKLDDLRREWYGEQWMEENSNKLDLTPAEGRDLMGMYEMAYKQDIWDLAGDYIKEHRFEAMYKDTLTLSAQLDRVRFFSTDDEGNIIKTYSLEDIETLLADLPRDEQKKTVQDM